MSIKRVIIDIVICLFVVGILFVGYQMYYVNQAHSSFISYYNFRGCVQLISKTDTEATCKLTSGQIIKIVKYQNKWYLSGDLPWF